LGLLLAAVIDELRVADVARMWSSGRNCGRAPCWPCRHLRRQKRKLSQATKPLRTALTKIPLTFRRTILVRSPT